MTRDQLTQALDRIKLSADPSVGASGTKSPPSSAAVKTGSGVADGDRQDMFGSPQAVHTLASILGVSEVRATTAAKQLSALADNGGSRPPVGRVRRRGPLPRRHLQPADRRDRPHQKVRLNRGSRTRNHPAKSGGVATQILGHIAS